MRFSRPQLVMFDLNWVIEDSTGLRAHALDFAARTLLVSISEQRALELTSSMYGCTPGSAPMSEHYFFWRRLLGNTRGVAAKDVPLDQVHDLFLQYLQRPMPASAIYSEVIGVLQSLREQGAKLAVVTNGNAHRVDAFLRHHGLYEMVDVVGASGELPHGKPHPTIFYRSEE